MKPSEVKIGGCAMCMWTGQDSIGDTYSILYSSVLGLWADALHGGSTRLTWDIFFSILYKKIFKLSDKRS
jgi:hypothetical protein